MNSRFFKLIFSRRLNALVAVGENCTPEGKSTSSSLSSSIFTDFFDKNIKFSARFSGLLALGFIWVASAFADPAPNALPADGFVVQGSASVVQQANQMVINQATDKAVINWQGFDIGAGASVNVLQPSSTSVLLNRVVGNNPSQIFGSLTANGHVILVNPNGIVFGADGSVTASAFTASTLGISDADFMAGNYRFVANGLAGSILNQGSINVTSSYVALLGANVTNDGKITTNQGNVYMGAAQAITVPVSNSGRIKMELDPASVNAALNNTQNSLIVTSGGQVLMQASAVNDAMATASINHAGQINTTATQAGDVSLLTDGGNIHVSGSVVAHSTSSANGGGDIIIGRDVVTGILAKTADVGGARLSSNKGFIETSGHSLTTDGISVNAATWLIDPDNIDITGDASAAINGHSKIKASDIALAINAGTNVIISTTVANRSNQPPYAGSTATGDGDILVNAAIVKSGSSNASLTLLADNGIVVNQRVGKSSTDTTSTGKLDITMIAYGNPASATSSKGITLNNMIDANGGVVTLTGTNKNTNSGNANSGVVFNNGSGISAATYTVIGAQTATSSAINNNGVIFSGTTNFISTTGASSIRGTSNAWGNFGQGILFNDSSTTNFTTTGLSTLSVVGVNASGGGTRAGYAGGAANINTNGTVTLGNNEAGGSWFQRGGTITAQTGILNISGSVINTYNGDARIRGGNGTTINLSAPSINFGSVPVAGEGAPSIGLASGATGYTLNLSADNLRVNTSIASVQNAGTGTITIKNFTDGTKINVGGSDVAASGSTPATLGLTNSELDTFRGANTIIGSSTAGDLTLSSAITTLSQTGNVSLQTAANIAINGSLTIASDKQLTLNATGASSAVTQSAALQTSSLRLLGATADYSLTNVNNGIGTLAANTRNLDLVTTNRTLVVGSVNSIDGITSTGNVNLSATNSAGSGIYIGQNITAQSGNVNITGTTSSSSNFNYGVQSAARVSAKNITMLASATSTAGTVLGYYGAGGVFNASEQLNLTGSSSNAGNGFYTYTGGFSSGTGMAITGTSALGQGVGLDNQITLTNGSIGGINVTGTATDASKQGIGLRGTAFNNAGGNTVITALSGNIFTSSGNLAWNTGVHTNTLTQGGTGSVQVSAGNGSATNSASIDGSVFSITQNNNAGVSVSTSGTGNLIAPKIVNGGSGDVVVAAGSSIAAGTGSGGQVLTLNGNNITNSSGKTYIYTGQASATGVLSNLDSSFNFLYYQGASHTLNAAFNQAYNSTITGGANAQVFFREATLPNFNLTLPAVTLTKTYGATDPTISDVIAAVQTAYTGPSVLSTSVAGVGGSNTFAFSATEAINSLSGLRAAGNNASITPYAYTLSSVLNTTVTGAQPGLRIDKAGLVAAIDSITTTYGTVVPLTAQFSGFAYGENAAGVGISLAGLTSAGYTGNTTTNNVQNGGYAITAASLANQNSTANYYISSISNGTLTINPATISVIANNASKLVTRSDPALTYSYSGLVNGDSSSIFSAPTLSRQIGESAGPYAITATGANAGSNYTVQYTPGVFTIAGVQKVLIQMSNVSTVYGTTVNPSIQSVEYINNSSVIFTLSRVANTNTWTDGVGGLITITPTLATATTNAGIYQNVVTNTNNGTATSSGNFNGVMTQTANVTIAPKVASINIVDVNRTYDGSAFTALQASASTSDLVNGDTIASLGGLSYLGSAIGSTAAGTYTIGANLTNPAAASNYSMTINSGTLTTRPVVVPTPAKEDKPFVNPVAPKPVTPAESGSKSQVSSSTTAQAVDVKLAAVEKPSIAEQCSATAGRSEKCDCQKTLFDEVLLCKVPSEGAGQPVHSTQKAKAHTNFN